MDAEQNRQARRDKQASRRRFGMRVSGGSVRLLAQIVRKTRKSPRKP